MSIVAAFDSSAVTIFARNTTTGSLAQLQGVAGCVSASGDASSVTCGQGRGLGTRRVAVVVSPDGSICMSPPANNAVAVFARNTLTGALAQLEGPAGCLAEAGDGA
jgi:hypothetical protein